MKTNVHHNSIESYYGIDLSKKQGEVVKALQALDKATDIQIAKYLNYTVNRVTGRITELQEKDVVIECDTTVGEFNKRVRVCRLKLMETELF